MCLEGMTLINCYAAAQMFAGLTVLNYFHLCTDVHKYTPTQNPSIPEIDIRHKAALDTR